jgi:hypothetical protein
MKSKTEEYKKIIVGSILKHLPDATVILYGSRARGDWKEGSDIDVAIDTGKVIDSKKMTAIMSEVEESKLPINFDIVDLHAISERIRHEIEKDGIVWHE